MFLHRAASLGAVCVFIVAAMYARDVRAFQTGTAASPALRSAVHAVWKNNPSIQVAEAELLAAQARSRSAAQPVYNPSLSLDGENADVDRRTLSASLPLDVTGKRRARVVEGDAAVRAREAAADLARRKVATEWLAAWSGASLLRAQAALGKRRVDLMARFDELAAQRLAVGDISRSERDLAALALSEAQIEQATLAGQQARTTALLTTLGTDPTEALPSLPRDLPPLPESVASLPLSDRPELRQAIAERDRAEAGVTVARRARLPDPTLSLTGGRVRSGNRSDRVIGVSVSFALPVLNSGSADIAAAQADADVAYASHRAATLGADARLVEATSTYATLHGAAAAFRSGRAGALDERTRLLEKLWEAGEIDTSDYLVQIKQSLDTALSGLALEGQTWQAWFDYLAATGRLDGWLDGTLQDTPR